MATYGPTAVTATADDVHERSDNQTVVDNGTELAMADFGSFTTIGGIRFQAITGPTQGARIHRAYIALTPLDTSSDDANLRIAGHDADDSGAWNVGAGTNDVVSRTKTTATVDWVQDGLGASEVLSPDLTTIVQEIVDRAGWASGNDMAFILTSLGGGKILVASPRNVNDTACPKLFIEYTNSVPATTGTPRAAGVRAAASTSLGVQYFTSSGFGTPQIAIVKASFGIVDGTIAAHEGWTKGAFDGTTQWAANTRGRDGVTPSFQKRSATTCVIQLTDSASTAVSGQGFATLTIDGIAITWVIAPPAGWIVTVELLAGFDQAKVGTVGLIGQQANNVDIGFMPDVLIGSHGSSEFENSTTVENIYSQFFAVRGTPIKQFCVGRGGDNSNPSNQAGIVADDLVLALPDLTGGLIRSAELTAFITSPVQGVEITRTDADAQQSDLGYIALKLPAGVSAWADIITTPTATGVVNYTAANFRPFVGFVMPAFQTAVGTSDRGFAIGGFGMFTATVQSCSVVSAEDNSATPACKSLTDAKPLVILGETGAKEVSADFDGFTATGVDFDYTVVNGTGRKVPMLLIQNQSTDPVGRVLVLPQAVKRSRFY